MTPQPLTTCAACGNPATDKCSGCRSINYCGKFCQTTHWKSHKLTCEQRLLEKALSRVAILVQKAYFDFSEQTFDTQIIKVEECGDQWLIQDGDQQRKRTYFVKFPQHLMKNEQMKQAVLCAWKCNEALGFLHQLLSGLLDGKSAFITGCKRELTILRTQRED
ncbi:hypothetical protein IAQ61_007843 [Plenodomus lingam]|uniref:uncharacterized protein n=1 Tax=Leptosphaeria maculans TaxID=5022 RepID=UPI0033227685|nr:hypothetical protein IAQ61_007843 [Plenodomus lingam]